MPEHYTIVLSSADVDTVGVALGKLPFELSARIYFDLKKQVTEQQAAYGNDTSIDNTPIGG